MTKIMRCCMFLIGVWLCLFPMSYHLKGQDNKLPYKEDVLGILKIPVIDLELPIYQGSDEEVLSQGIGCITENSSLTGGESTHNILVGHRGLLDAEMFLRLDELKMGDVFVIYVSGTEIQYEVCEIQVILPEETDCLKIQEGRDLVSLITCTPYGINTHRLVVMGERKVKDESIH